MQISEDFTQKEKQQIKYLYQKELLKTENIDWIEKSDLKCGYIGLEGSIYSNDNLAVPEQSKYFECSNRGYAIGGDFAKNLDSDYTILILHCMEDEFDISTIYYSWDKFPIIQWKIVNFTQPVDRLVDYSLSDLTYKGLDNYSTCGAQFDALKPFIYSFRIYKMNYRTLPQGCKNDMYELNGDDPNVLIHQFNEIMFDKLKHNETMYLVVDAGDCPLYFNNPCHVDLMSTGMFFEHNKVYVI